MNKGRKDICIWRGGYRGTHKGYRINKGCRRDTQRIYDTQRIQKGYTKDTQMIHKRIHKGYRRDTQRVHKGYTEETH